MKSKKIISLLVSASLMLSITSAVSAAEISPFAMNFTISEPNADGIVYVHNTNGATLGMTEEFSEDYLLIKNGYAFKDLNKNGRLDAYEDWRLTTEERAENLAGLMVADGVENEGIQSIAGLMLYSSHTSVNSPQISDATMTALNNEYLRHVLVTSVSNPETAAKWSNNVQAYLEGVLYGIPANNSSDPRHAASSSNMEYEIGATGNISLWPTAIGLAATFDPDAVLLAGQVLAAEYRGLGITTGLSPMIDLATDPRWSRFSGTFGEDSKLATEMARNYVDGYQNSYALDLSDGVNFGEDSGWGSSSVNAMVKHWPGGGAGEGGRDAHYNYGKFAVYPGDNLAEHMSVFTEGAFKLNGKTESATAVMPYYTISYDQDPSGDNVGNSYSRYIIQDQLRETYKFKGVVCTDWNIVYDVGSPWSFGGMCWGMENDNITDRFIRLLEVGIDQFGGVNAIENIMLAYDKMVVESGATEANAIMKQHAERLLTNIFNVGLFENPYLDTAESASFVGNAEFMQAGYETQLKSITMLKNSDNVISADGLEGKVYATNVSDTTQANIDASKALFGNYFGNNYVEDMDDAEAVVIVMNAPTAGGGYNQADFTSGAGNGYFPITLQYSPYTATNAREQSIAADPTVYWPELNNNGQPNPYVGYDVDNRSYKDKTVSNATNIATLEKYNTITAAAEEKGIPVILYVRASNPMVWSEVEPAADAIVVGYSVQTQAALDIITGKAEPSAMLPAQQPADMATVEEQYEDLGHDMRCHVDENGNKYDFGFGLNYAGVIGVDSPDARYDEYVEEHRQEVVLWTGFLEYVIDEAKALIDAGVLDQADLYPGVADRFYEALAKAEEVLAKVENGTPTITQDHINEATYDLLDAIHMTDWKVKDKSKLQKLVDTVRSYTENGDKYIQSTFTPFMDAFNAAEAVLATHDFDLEDSDIEAAWQALAETAAKLRLIPDKSALQKSIKVAEEVNLSLYTAKTAEPFKAALDTAKKVNDSEDAEQKTVDVATTDLNTKHGNLIPLGVDDNASKTDDTSKTDDESSATKTANPKTGDINLPLFMLMMAAGSVITIAVKKRKENE